MASTVATASADDSEHPPLRPDSVPVVDLSLLSQSELYSLSLSSDSFDLKRCDDVVIPKINRAIFNESAGSRKQTYSRLRLASADSIKTPTLHRRTPHLRTSHTHPSNNINDPEQVENSQIIRILKQLCKSDPNFQDIDQIEDEDNTDNNSVLPEYLNSETLGIKRKRGRPRKHANLVFIRSHIEKRLRNHTVNKEIVYDEKDREIVNDRGVKVNLATLAGLEDPYGPEIRRRTVGMLTEDELLGFLRGLNGQWGSRRRKRRVVDASEFGDALPKGWKLSLCIKKKEGRVWLYCRRYLSPSGQQFETCKEISAYLISLFEEENLDKQNFVNINSSDDFALKEVTENAAEFVLQEDIKRDDPVDNPSSSSPLPSPTSSPSPSPSPSPPPLPPPAPPEPANCEEQVNLDAMEVQVNDDVKNDHIGTHLKDDLEKIEPFLPPTSELDNPVLVADGDNGVVETDDAHSGDKLGTCKESNSDELVHDLNFVSHSEQDEHTRFSLNRNDFIEESCDESCKKGITNDEVSRTDQAPDAAVSQSKLLGDELLLSISEKSNQPETSDEIHDNRVENKPESNLDQGLNSGKLMGSPSPNGQTSNASGVREDDINACATDQVLDLDAVSETGVSYVDSTRNKSECILNDQAVSETPLVENASICEEKGFDPTMDLDMDVNNMSDQLISVKEKVVGDPSSGFFLGRFGLDKDGATVVKGIDSIKAVNKLSSGSTSSRPDGPFDVGTNAFGSYGAPSGMDGVSAFQEEIEVNKNLGSDVSFSNMEEPMMQIDSNKSEEVKLDDFNIFTDNEAKSNESEDDLDFNTKSNLEFCSLVPSENEQEFGFQDCLYDNTMDECKEESSERGLLNHFSDNIFENKMYSTPLDGLKFDEDRDLSSNELSLAFGNPNVPSKIEEAFDVHTNLSMVNSSMVEDSRGSVSGLFNLSGNVKTRNFQHAWDGIKSDEFQNSGNKFTSAFGGNRGQAHEEVVPSGMWRTGDESRLQSGLSIPSHAHIPSPSSFHSFNIMSEKARDGPLRLDERYNEGYGVNGLRSGRPEPVEFSFLTERSQLPLQADSRVYSYNAQMDQQFDSPFWLGKNTMMPNPSGRNPLRGVCALCRNEFHLHPVHFGTQDGMASLCLSCSAGMSGHLNML